MAAGGGATVFSATFVGKQNQNRNFLHQTPSFFHTDFKSGIKISNKLTTWPDRSKNVEERISLSLLSSLFFRFFFYFSVVLVLSLCLCGF
jgi:hypothetical protein